MQSEIRFAMRHVLRSRTRLRRLLALNLDGVMAFSTFLTGVVPLARAALAQIEALAQAIPDDRLRHEALASITAKAYHVAGGSILATFLPRSARTHYVEIVAPLESIYDFLDNLCDRHPGVPVEAYPVLHRALEDALDPLSDPRTYYDLGPAGDDGGYLQALVRRTRAALSRVAGHERLLAHFRESARLYAELQTYKHYPPQQREAACVNWHRRHRERFGDLSWWEFASAAGSQFGVYGPLYALLAGEYDEIEPVYDAYFPAFSAVHVLLDYFIDQAEDREHGELNFVECYPDSQRMRERMRELSMRARRRFEQLARPRAHAFVLHVMALFYLTHPKVFEQGLDGEAQALLAALA